MQPQEPWEYELIQAQRIAHLATIGTDMQPAVVPVVYAYDGERFLTPLDGKPKRVALTKLRRVRDIRANPQVALVIDRYTEDWSQLTWLQVRGMATILDAGPIYTHGIALLVERYPQYATVALIGLPLIVIEPSMIRSWRAVAS
jgi:PPOX class probable F420-dependent enzyme